MPVDFKKSKTKENLMRAFAGESQARNRYTIAEGQCKQQQLYVLADLFKFTADQEKEHGEIFYNHLSQCSGEDVEIKAGFPIDDTSTVEKLLESAVKHEKKEFDDVYPAFATVAREEGFAPIAQSFENIAKIENSHRARFDTFHKLMTQNKLFSSDQSETWVCLNCGYILEGKQAPQICPVCQKPQGYYIRLNMASWGA